MPTQASTNKSATTPHRRSQRLLDSKIKKSNSSSSKPQQQQQQVLSPISFSILETHIKSPPHLPSTSTLQEDLMYVLPLRSTNSTDFTSGSKRPTTIITHPQMGSTRRSPWFSITTPHSSRFTPQPNIGNQVEDKFQALRRSPRFLLTTPHILVNKDNKMSAKMTNQDEPCRRSRRLQMIKTPITSNEGTLVNGHNDGLESADIIDSMPKEVPSEGVQRRKSLKRGRRSAELMSSKDITGQPELDVTTPITGKGKKKKRRNTKCGTNGDFDNSDTQQCKELQLVSEAALAHWRTPLGSKENIPPKNEKLVSRGKTSTKLVESNNVLKKCVKSGARKKPEGKKMKSQCGVGGWTKDQQLALQRAYFTAKPSPHFWKKISKMVPGKSAQDCFDKVQTNSITPLPQPRYSSRANKTNSSPLGQFSLSGSKLLESTKANCKKSRGNKRNKVLAQKTVRHILQKQNQVSQGYKRDLFSILEPTVTPLPKGGPETKALSSPISLMDRQDFLHSCQKRSSSSHKKPFSRFRGSGEAPLASPPVLKQIKNIAGHEKYIDQLHTREARRTAEARRCTNVKKSGKENMPIAIKAAKNALVSDASEMIKKFQDMQANVMDHSEDIDDVGESSGGDDEEC